MITFAKISCCCTRQTHVKLIFPFYIITCSARMIHYFTWILKWIISE